MAVPLLLAVVVAGGLALIWQGSDSTRSGDAAVSTSSTLASDLPDPSPVDDQERSADEAAPLIAAFDALDEPVGHVLVAPTDRGYLLLDLDRGEVSDVVTERTITSMHSAGTGGGMFVLFDDGELGVLTAGLSEGRVIAPGVERVLPAADGEQLWVATVEQPDVFRLIDLSGKVNDTREAARTAQIDPRYQSEPGGGTYLIGDGVDRLGPHHLAAVGNNILVGRLCDAKARCVFQWFDGTEWAGTPHGLEAWPHTRALVDPTDTWIAVVSPERAQLEIAHVRGSTQFVVGWDAEQGPATTLFASDGRHLFLLQNDRARVLEVSTIAPESVAIPPGLTDGTYEWTVVPAPYDAN